MSKTKKPNGVPRRPVDRLQQRAAFTRPSAHTTWAQAARRTPRHGHSR